MSNELTSHAVFYNIWGHRVPEGINNYIKLVAEEADVICLTEVTHMGRVYWPVPAVHTSSDMSEPPTYLNGLEQIDKTVGRKFRIHYSSPNDRSWECLKSGLTYEEIGFGSALLINRDLKEVVVGSLGIVFNSERANDRVLQFVVYIKGGTRYMVAHFHGVWLRDNTKGDDPLRDLQSALVLSHLFNMQHIFRVEKIVFGGDFNLSLDTRALRQFEYDEDGESLYQNLIRQHGIQNTRTAHYRKFHLPNEPMHADYAFVSPNVEVKKFSVENHIEASDHAPLHVIFR